MGSTHSSMLSIKELVNLFTTPPQETDDCEEDNRCFSDTDKPSANDNINEEVDERLLFAPVIMEESGASFLMKTPSNHHSHIGSDEKEHFFCSDDEDDRGKHNKSSKSILKKGSPRSRSPNENKIVHWGEVTVCPIDRNSILTEKQQPTL